MLFVLGFLSVGIMLFVCIGHILEVWSKNIIEIKRRLKG